MAQLECLRNPSFRGHGMFSKISLALRFQVGNGKTWPALSAQSPESRPSSSSFADGLYEIDDSTDIWLITKEVSMSTMFLQQPPVSQNTKAGIPLTRQWPPLSHLGQEGACVLPLAKTGCPTFEGVQVMLLPTSPKALVLQVP